MQLERLCSTDQCSKIEPIDHTYPAMGLPSRHPLLAHSVTLNSYPIFKSVFEPRMKPSQPMKTYILKPTCPKISPLSIYKHLPKSIPENPAAPRRHTSKQGQRLWPLATFLARTDGSIEGHHVQEPGPRHGECSTPRGCRKMGRDRAKWGLDRETWTFQQPKCCKRAIEQIAFNENKICGIN